MNVKRYFSNSMQDALRQVREDLGPDAVILSNTKQRGGIEILATAEYSETPEETVAASPREEQVVVGPSELARQRAEKSIRLQEELERSREKIASVRSRPERSSMSEERAASAKLNDANNPAAHKATAPGASAPQESDVLKSVQAELSELRSLIAQQQKQQAQASAFGHAAAHAVSPVQTELSERLESLNIQPGIRKKLVDVMADEGDVSTAWAKVRKQLHGAMQAEYSEMIDMGGVVSLVGPTGSGKTMTIGKLAARYVMRHGPESLALVTTDRYRIAAHEQLKVFGRILNVPVHVVDEQNCLDDILDRCSDRKLVLIDTAGLMQSDKCWNEQLKELKMSAHQIQNYLVVPATGQYGVMKSSYKHYKMVGLAGTIITKLDEAVSLGEVISYLVSSKLACAYFTDGQRVPEDIHMADKKELLNKAEALLNSSERWVTIPSQKASPASARYTIQDTA